MSFDYGLSTDHIDHHHDYGGDVDSHDCPKILPIMITAGMYDFSGTWSFSVGVPAKSGVGGCVFLVIPGVCGVSIFSPRLDGNGNSERGVDFAERLSKKVLFENSGRVCGFVSSVQISLLHSRPLVPRRSGFYPVIGATTPNLSMIEGSSLVNK